MEGMRMLPSLARIYIWLTTYTNVPKPFLKKRKSKLKLKSKIKTLLRLEPIHMAYNRTIDNLKY